MDAVCSYIFFFAQEFECLRSQNEEEIAVNERFFANEHVQLTEGEAGRGM